MFFNDLDQTGWRLSLQEPPKRIVSLVPSQTELLHNLGVMDYLVGRTKFCVHPNEIQTIPVVGGTKQINRERLLEVKPDLVIGNHEKNTKEDIEWIRESFLVWLSKVNSLKDGFSMIHSNRTSSKSIKGGSADNGENKKSHSKENKLSKVVSCILDLEQTHDGCSRKHLY